METFLYETHNDDDGWGKGREKNRSELNSLDDSTRLSCECFHTQRLLVFAQSESGSFLLLYSRNISYLICCVALYDCTYIYDTH